MSIKGQFGKKNAWPRRKGFCEPICFRQQFRKE
jgi:hypothetical protein